MNELLDLLQLSPNADTHRRYAENLNIDNAAALLLSWTDKQHAAAKGITLKNEREFHDERVTEGQRTLYRHLVYAVLDAAVQPKVEVTVEV